MKKTTHIFPIMALSTLLAACGSGGKGADSHHIAKPAPKTPPVAVQKQPEVAKPAEVHNKPEMVKPVEAQKQPEVVKPVEIQKEPEVMQPVEAQKQPEVVKPVEVQKQPEVVKPVEIQKEPETVKPVEIQKEPEVVKPVEVQKQPEVVQPVEAQKQPEIVKPVEAPIQQPKLEKIVWSDAANFAHSKDAVPVIYLIENDQAESSDDPNIKEKQNAVVALQLGKNQDDKNHYLFYAFDNAYYGFYRDSHNMMSVVNNYVYSFNEKAENKADLSGLNATYKGKFIYSTRSIPELAMPAELELRYKDGKAEGEIISHLHGDKLFDVVSTDKARSLELNPARETLDNSFEELVVRPDSPDRAFINVHFINGNEGTENKTLVGKGGNEKYWGVIGAEKQ